MAIKLFTLAAICAASLLSGCAGSPARVSMSSDEELKSMSSPVLCNAYAYKYSPQRVRAVLEERKVLTEQEWEAIDKRHIFIGMSAFAVRCAWGVPNDINRTITKYGTSEQWVYGHYGRYASSRKYIYLTNGVVTALQD